MTYVDLALEELSSSTYCLSLCTIQPPNNSNNLPNNTNPHKNNRKHLQHVPPNHHPQRPPLQHLSAHTEVCCRHRKGRSQDRRQDCLSDHCQGHRGRRYVNGPYLPSLQTCAKIVQQRTLPARRRKPLVSAQRRLSARPRMSRMRLAARHRMQRTP